MSKADGVIVQKQCKLQSTSLTLTFDPQINRGLPPVMGNTRYMYMYACAVPLLYTYVKKAIELSCGNNFSRDRQIALVEPVYPLHNLKESKRVTGTCISRAAFERRGHDLPL